MDSKYTEIQAYIRQAQIERSVVVAEILTDVIMTACKGVRTAAESVLGVAQSLRRRSSIFTFDA